MSKQVTHDKAAFNKSKQVNHDKVAFNKKTKDTVTFVHVHDSLRIMGTDMLYFEISNVLRQ